MGRAPMSSRLSLFHRIVVPRLGDPERASSCPLGNQNTDGGPLPFPLAACGQDPLAVTTALGSPGGASGLLWLFGEFPDFHGISPLPRRACTRWACGPGL